jgi:hypothetical protein
MRFVAVLAVAVFAALSAAASPPTVEELFTEYRLFGDWAGDCGAPASGFNPHVNIAALSPGLVIESHDLGSDYAQNRYSVLAAERVSETSVQIKVIFQPGTLDEERQTLVFLVHDGTRRTMFNQPDGGAVRVNEGIALASGMKTPVLKKCE